MSLIKLDNGHKYEIEQPNEGEGMMRNRRRNTVQLTFRADAEQFDAIRADIVPDNLEIFTIYYPDNETADEPDEQLTGVAHKDFSAYALVGDWEDKEVEKQKETSKAPAVYGRQLSVTLGERLASDI
jgi:hypothetical protein